MTTDDIHLFGLPGSEYLEFDLAAAYESYIEPTLDDEPVLDFIVNIEEWTSTSLASMLPTAGDLLVNIIERWCEDTTEDGYEHWQKIIEYDDVVAAFASALELLGSKVTYRHADKLIITHVIKWNADGEPLVDGEPLYVKRQDQD